MDDVIWSIGIAGSIASLIGIIIAAKGAKSKLIHVAYAFAISALAVSLHSYQSELNEMHRIQKQAFNLLKSGEMQTSRGFSLAAMAFLEKHKDRLPDTYERAEILCEKHNCLGSSYSDGTSDLNHMFGLTDVEYSLKGLIEGIAVSE